MTTNLRTLRSLLIRSIRRSPGLLSACAVVGLAMTVSAQAPGPSPSPDPDERFTVRGTTEIGARWVDVNGFENKFRSDFNYRNGFRLFDSSLVIDDNSSSGRKLFDSAMIIASGWGADPSGMVRVNMELSGQYRLDANVRRIAYHSDLRNFAIGG
jgi:hypothetical protein